MSQLRIVHFSDPHTGGLAEDCLAFWDKRWVGVFNYTFRRRFKFDVSYLRKFVTAMLQNPPDLIVCTGDLTSTGQQGEFSKALNLLRPLIRAKIPMLYVPGNHDYYVFHHRCNQAMKNVFRRLNCSFSLEFDALPQKRIFKDVRFLIVNESMPSNLISSCGYLSAFSSDFLTRICVNNAESPFTILIGHYPIIEKNPILRIRHRLFGQKNIVPLIQYEKIDLSLNGHVHAPYTRLNAHNRGEVCAGSISKNQCYAEILLDTETKNIQIQYYRLDSEGKQALFEPKKEVL